MYLVKLTVLIQFVVRIFIYCFNLVTHQNKYLHPKDTEIMYRNVKKSLF